MHHNLVEIIRGLISFRYLSEAFICPNSSFFEIMMATHCHYIFASTLSFVALHAHWLPIHSQRQN